MIRYTQPLEKWYNILIAATEVRGTFTPGSHDCATWVCDTILRLQEAVGLPQKDYFEDFRGKYTTDEEGLALAQASGGLEACITAQLGEPIPVLWHLDGCIALKDTCIGLVVGRHVSMVTDEEVLSAQITLKDKIWMIPGIHELINE